MCICIDNIPHCGITDSETDLYPGNILNIAIVAVGQRNGTAVAPVMAKMTGDNNQIIGKVGDLQTIQVVQKTCTSLSYTIMTPNKQETLLLIPFKGNEFGLSYRSEDSTFGTQLINEHPYKLGLLFKQLTIKINIKDCPLGFPLDQVDNICICPKSLISLGLSCDSVNYKILRSKRQWVGMTYSHTINEREIPGIIAHQYCPYDYCNTNNESLSIDLEHLDDQCSSNRTGILCGGCQANFSQVFGSSRCKKLLKFHASSNYSQHPISRFAVNSSIDGPEHDRSGRDNQWINLLCKHYSSATS